MVVSAGRTHRRRTENAEISAVSAPFRTETPAKARASDALSFAVGFVHLPVLGEKISPRQVQVPALKATDRPPTTRIPEGKLEYLWKRNR